MASTDVISYGAAGPYKMASYVDMRMQVAIISNDLLEEKFTVVALHPGWVQTGESHQPGCDKNAALRSTFQVAAC